MKRVLSTCDRPGCGKEVPGDLAEFVVWIRSFPYGSHRQEKMDLCPACADELRRKRIDTDLEFGDRLREVKHG